MKRLALLLTLLAAPAHAQTVDLPADQQIKLLIGSLIVTNTDVTAQLAQAQSQIKDLKKQIEEAKKPKPDAPNP